MEQMLVARVVFEQRPPFTGESLFAAVSFSGAELDVSRLATYQVLDELCEAGLVAGDGECLERFFHTAQPPLPGDVSPERCATWHGIMSAGNCRFCGRSVGNSESA